MESIVKSIVVLSASLFLSFQTLTVKAQNEKLQTAFLESYSQEYAGEYGKAISALKAAYSESSYEVNLRLGWLHYMSGLFTESVAYYQKAMTLSPYSIEAKLGYVYPASALGNWEQVIKQYNEILKIDAQNITANYRLGLIYYGRENYSTSFKYFEKCVNMYPFTYDYLIYFAWNNLKTGKVREAKILFNKVLLASPNDNSALEGLKLIK